MVKIKGKKPIVNIGKGDKIKVDGKQLEVDSHYVLMEHGKSKEMVIELFDPKTEKEYQLRYFNDRAEESMEFFELQGEIMYSKVDIEKVEW